MALLETRADPRGRSDAHLRLTNGWWNGGGNGGNARFGRGLRAKTRTAFILSGGGARGALQVGALRALMEAGIRPDIVIGTSIGAWNGAWLAYRPTAEGVASIAAAWRSVHIAGVLLGHTRPLQRPPGAQRGLLMLVAARRVSRGHPSMFSNIGPQRLLERFVGDLTFEDTAIPFRVIVTDLTHGTRVALKSGPLIPAILASSALPGIFPPVRIGEAVYTDGGPLDDASVDCALELGANRLFILAIGPDGMVEGSALFPGELFPRAESERVRQGRAQTPVTVVQRSSQVMGRYHLERALQRLPRGVEAHVIELCTSDNCGMLDFDRAAGWIDHAYPLTRDYLRRVLPHAMPLSRQAV